MKAAKGDFFGPLVIAGVYVDRGIARKFLDAGVQDSKRIGSDARIRALADSSARTRSDCVDTVPIGPERYNDLYEKFGNLNRLLGWGHARVIENLLAKKPDCPRSLSDKFADARVIRAIAFATRPQDRPRTTDKSGIGCRGGGGFDPGAGSIHRLAGARGKALGVKIGTRRFGAR